MDASLASHRRAAFAAISAHTRCRSAGELEIAAKIPAVAACCSRPSASSPLAWESSPLDWESSLVSSWILRSAEARSSVGEAVMATRASHATCPRAFGLPHGAGYSIRAHADATRYGGAMETARPDSAPRHFLAQSCTF